MAVIAPGPGDEGATFYINNVSCGTTSAPIMPTLSALGNLTGGGQFPKNLGPGTPIADVRVFGGHHLTEEDRSALLDMVPQDERGSGPGAAAMTEAKAKQIVEGIERFENHLKKLKDDPLSAKPAAAFGIDGLAECVTKFRALADGLGKTDGAAVRSCCR